MKKRYIIILLIIVNINIYNYSYSVNTKTIQKLDDAKKYYQQNKIAKALSNLEQVFKEILDEQLDKIGNIFPKPISPWKAEEIKKEYLEASIKSKNGFSFRKNYYIDKTEKSININLVVNSPAIKDYISLIENKSKDFTISIIKGKYKSLEKYLLEEKFGEINIIINQNVMISVIASNITSKKTIQDLINRINFTLIENIFS